MLFYLRAETLFHSIVANFFKVYTVSPRNVHTSCFIRRYLQPEIGWGGGGGGDSAPTWQIDREIIKSRAPPLSQIHGPATVYRMSLNAWFIFQNDTLRAIQSWPCERGRKSLRAS
jgi:hypothetical protein